VSGFQTNAHASTTTFADATHASVHRQQAAEPQQHTPRITAAEKIPATAITTAKAHVVTEIASATLTTVVATEPEATHEPTKASLEFDVSQRLLETNYHHPHRRHQK
jgi:hypothetical protein